MVTNAIEWEGRRRRRHSDEFRAAVIEKCRHPGVSVAAMALAHQLNANMLRKWVREDEHKRRLATTAALPAQTPEPPPSFVPRALPATAPVQGDIHIELQRAGATAKIVWPANAARDCGNWLSDWLRR